MISEELAGAGSPQGGQAQPFTILHNYLVIENDKTGEWVPQLATERISVDKGTWRINPDGSMDTTWKLRANIKWHDGRPFTAEDLVFSLTVLKDPEIPAGSSGGGPALRLMESATAPDPHTLAIHWSGISVTADEAHGIDPMARHVLEDVYKNDKPNFENSPRFREEFVGLGPYRLVAWERGSHMEMQRFDEYFLGRPLLDKVVVRFMQDANTTIANIFAGAVDVLTIRILEIDTAAEIRQRWLDAGHQMDIYPDRIGFDTLEVQHRPEYARPQRNGLTNTIVRRAFYQAIDRKTLAEAMTHGFAPVADSWYSPSNELRAQLEPFIPQFPYDPAQAVQLLEQAGWVRGRDGVLTHTQTGDRFEVTVTGRQDDLRTQAAIADDWKAIGAVSTLVTHSPAEARDRQTISTHPGVLVTGGGNYNFLISNRLHTRFMTSAANQWTGANRSGYSNPKVDAVLDTLVVTIDPRQRLELHKELLREQMGDVALMPLFWSTHVWFAVAGVRGIRDGNTWNIAEWDRA